MDKKTIPLQKPKIIAVVGPTASGKTALAIELAKNFNGEIISADSCQIYRGMDIGTAKPLILRKQKKIYSQDIRHYLIDIKKPDQKYNLAEYQKDAIKAIRLVLNKGKLPILAGGTGLYIKSVVDNLNLPKAKPSPKLRKGLENRIKKQGIESVFKELVELDPEAAYIVDPKNPRRIIRALEITLQTGIPFSKQRQANPPLFNFLQIGIAKPNQILKKRICQRVDEMMQQGALQEVKALVKKYGVKCPAFDAIGYREFLPHLANKAGFSESVEQIKTNTWHYAKRQMTWFKKDKRIKWVSNTDKALKLAKDFLAK